MEITDVRVRMVAKEGKMKAVVSITLDSVFVVHDIKVIEGERERLQAFEGIVIAKKHGGISETFTVRRLSFGIGVEKTFPIHSPKVADIQVVRRGKVKRAKLYYLRARTGKAAKVKEIAK